MPLIQDDDSIRRVLRTDRVWAVYMIADLEPPYRDHCEWHGDGGEAVVLLYRGLQVPVLVALGPEDRLPPLVREVAGEPRLYLSVRPGVVPLFEGAGYRMETLHRMRRMVLDPKAFDSAARDGAVRLGPGDLDAVTRLYSDGDACGERPPFFDPSMLGHGVYYGLWEGAELVAAGGTHVLAPSESVAGIGNIYTRRDRRGRGFARRVTAAVTAELLALGLAVIALNVAEANVPAIRVYERLGFRCHCEYCEGVAVHRD